jgi:hypothetical protein
MRLFAAAVALVVSGCLLPGLLGAAAHASSTPSPPRPDARAPSRADRLARLLAADPVHVTDHALRRTPPGTAERIKAQTARLGVPVHVVVEPRLRNGTVPPSQLIPMLRRRLRRDGIYIVTSPGGYGAARQYGGSLPAGPAWDTTYLELPEDADAADRVQRFVEILTAPDPARRIAQRRPRPDSAAERRDKEIERKELMAFGTGMAITGGGVFLLLLGGRLSWERKQAKARAARR